MLVLDCVFSQDGQTACLILDCFLRMLVLDFVFSQDGQTALAIAAREGHVEIVQDLLSKGAYVNVGDRVSNLLLWPTSHLHMYIIIM